MNVKLGKYNQLEVVKEVDFGVYLDGGDDGEILLPTRYVPEGCKPGDVLNVFLYLDNEERLIATTLQPLVQVDEFACLEVAQSISGVDHEADYRALTINGEYIWIRDVVHVVRKPNGEVDSLVGFMFDISERKKKEQELEILKKQLEEYSYQDGLTEIANRRFFEDSYQREWLNAQREQQPLTLMLLDIDYFKQYNDHNGHLLGDACLKQIAQILKKSVSRPRDLVARFGGEEFVLILPDTTQASAIEVVERILQSIRTADICHSTSPLDQRLSVSLGVKTIIPTQKNDKMAFLKEVDQNLYLAKERGRNGYVIQDAEDVQHLNSY